MAISDELRKKLGGPVSVGPARPSKPTDPNTRFTPGGIKVTGDERARSIFGASLTEAPTRQPRFPERPSTQYATKGPGITDPSRQGFATGSVRGPAGHAGAMRRTKELAVMKSGLLGEREQALQKTKTAGALEERGLMTASAEKIAAGQQAGANLRKSLDVAESGRGLSEDIRQFEEGRRDKFVQSAMKKNISAVEATSIHNTLTEFNKLPTANRLSVEDEYNQTLADFEAAQLTDDEALKALRTPGNLNPMVRDLMLNEYIMRKARAEENSLTG